MHAVNGCTPFVADLSCGFVGYYVSGLALASRSPLLAEHPHLGGIAVFAVHVDGEVFKVVDQLFEVLRLDLRQGEGTPCLLKASSS